MWDQQASRALADTMLSIIERNMAQRIDAQGKPYPPGRDNVESGRLVRSFVSSANENKATVANIAPYAAPVNAQVEFMGVPPADMPELHRAVERETARLLGATV